MLIAWGTESAASRGKRRMPCAQVTRSSKIWSLATIGGGAQAEQQRCGQGRPTGAAAESSNAFGESWRSASGSEHGLKRSPNDVDVSCAVPVESTTTELRISIAAPSSGVNGSALAAALLLGLWATSDGAS